MDTKKPQPQSIEKCPICGEDETQVYDVSLCYPCLRKKIARETAPESTDPEGKTLKQNRFDWDYADFDAECSLGGRPDDDAWFKPRHFDSCVNGIVYLF